MTAEILESPELADERPVDVIDQPTRERHVPVRPELPDVSFEKGIVEILRELDADQAGATQGQVGIAGEIEIEIEGVCIETENRPSKSPSRRGLLAVWTGYEDKGVGPRRIF